MIIKYIGIGDNYYINIKDVKKHEEKYDYSFF